VCNLSVATSERWNDRQSGEKRERTEWHRVVVFNENLVNVCERFLRKGSKVYVEGQLETRKWTDQQSQQERYSTEVVLRQFRSELTILDSRQDGGQGGYDQGGGGEYDQGSGPAPAGRSGPSAPAPARDLDDDIPF
jgi:single-strand DNA-binding protein